MSLKLAVNLFLFCTMCVDYVVLYRDIEDYHHEKSCGHDFLLEELIYDV